MSYLNLAFENEYQKFIKGFLKVESDETKELQCKLEPPFMEARNSDRSPKSVCKEESSKFMPVNKTLQVDGEPVEKRIHENEACNSPKSGMAAKFKSVLSEKVSSQKSDGSTAYPPEAKSKAKNKSALLANRSLLKTKMTTESDEPSVKSKKRKPLKRK